MDIVGIISMSQGSWCRSHRLSHHSMSFWSHRLPTLFIRAALRSTIHPRVLSTIPAVGGGNCPKCHSALPTPLPACPKCSFISGMPSNIKYHEMFGLPSTDNPFKVDDKQLTRRFRKLQQTVHPDAWSAKGEVGVCRILNVPFQPIALDSPQEESSAAANLSSLVNHAFKTLQNPVLRAEHILREQGIDLSESEQTLEDPELLMQIMESREALDEATSQERVDVIVSETQGQFNLHWWTPRLSTFSQIRSTRLCGRWKNSARIIGGQSCRPLQSSSGTYKISYMPQRNGLLREV